MAIFQYLSEPSIWIGIAATSAVVYFARSTGPQAQLESWEVRAATWYLLNGLVFHYVFDFCVPVFNAVPIVRSCYQEMDLRYGCRPEFGACAGKTGVTTSMDPVMWVVCHIECMVDAPLCMLVFVAYLQGWAIRKPLELLLAGLQIAGTIVFQGTELAGGLRHTPPPPNNVGGSRGMLEHLTLNPWCLPFLCSQQSLVVHVALHSPLC